MDEDELFEEGRRQAGILSEKLLDINSEFVDARDLYLNAFASLILLTSQLGMHEDPDRVQEIFDEFFDLFLKYADGKDWLGTEGQMLQ